MGTTLRVALPAPDRGRAIGLIEQVFGEVGRLERMLSTWRDDSEMAGLNTAPPNRPVRLSAELYRLLAEAADWSRATGGAFDPAIGALVDAWGLRAEGRVPSEPTLARARRASALDRFGFCDPERSITRRDSLAWLDTGGFGKGAALREAGRLLRAEGVRSARLNFGGQVLALGGDEQGRAWAVPVADPVRRDRPAVALAVRDRSVSTSGQSERGVRVGGRWLGHVLDPRSGLPVESWGSVTVVAEDAVAADILSTALLVLGPEEALRWAERRSDVGVLLLVVRGGRAVARWNRAMEPYLRANTTSTRRG